MSKPKKVVKRSCDNCKEWRGFECGIHGSFGSDCQDFKPKPKPYPEGSCYVNGGEKKKELVVRAWRDVNGLMQLLINRRELRKLVPKGKTSRFKLTPID